MQSLILLTDLAGSVLICGFVFHALYKALLHRDTETARLLIAEGVIWGLSIKLAATLLKTVELHTWQQIGLFSCVLGLRTLLKQVFARERKRVQRHRNGGIK